MIRYEDSIGLWATWEYDEKGNVIRYETSSGYWQTQEYDAQGREISMIHSHGTIDTDYDEDGRITCITELATRGDGSILLKSTELKYSPNGVLIESNIKIAPKNPKIDERPMTIDN